MQKTPIYLFIYTLDNFKNNKIQSDFNFIWKILPKYENINKFAVD
jgi:hypothetical protein